MKTKVRIKSRVVHDTLHNRDIIEMFHGILGTNDESISLHVVYPKYETLCSLSTKFIEILNVLYRSSVLSKFDDSTKERLGGYVQELRELSHLTFTAPDIRPYLPELPLQLNMTLGVEDFTSSPDVNVDEFVEVIKTSIEEVRRHLPRCEMAFDKILTSVDTFKENFEKYYHDYIVSNNPTSIMENFIFDVSKTSDLSPDMTRQFQQIIAYYRKLAPLQTADPRLQNLFHHVDKNIQELERNKFTMSETSTC
ncbi:hypothetical protein GLOIN_2v1482498 [Rhizophagus irregularis DAOM 181602=DAOM 197198]|nr:hypothetical protein GLOIN_2v1482498 [Rhizophagus irregularis DAOM 181602=DAOM 197198]